MSTTPVQIDPSTVTRFDNPQTPNPAQELQKSVAFASTQNPDQYAKLLKLQQQTGVHPVVAQGNEADVKQAADVSSLDYDTLAASHPRTTAWASKPDNAAVSGVDEITRLANMELARQGLSVGPMPRRDLLDVMQPEKTASTYFWLEDKPQPEDVSFRNLTGDQRKQAELIALRDRLRATVPELGMKPQLTVPGVTRGLLDYATPGGFGTAAYDTPVGLGKLGIAAVARDKNLALEGGAQALEGVGTALSAGVASGIVEAPLRTTAALIGYQLSSEAAAQSAKGLGWSPAAQRLVAAAVGIAPLGLEMFTHRAAIERLVNESEQSKLRERSPEAFHDAMQKMFEGDPSLRIPANEFQTYFQSKQMDPAQVAESLGSKNFAEAVLSGGDVEVPTEGFLAKLDPEHQRALLGDIVDPAIGLSQRQQEAAQQEIKTWMESGGPERLSADTAKVDAETQASDEYQAVKSQLLKQYTDAGETPEIADNYATLQANVYSNLARETGLKASELMGLYRPVMKVGDAAQGSLKQVTPEQAKETNVPVEMPTQEEFANAVANTPGAKVTEDGLSIDLVRYQKPEQEGAQAIRTGVFYLPKGSAAEKFYRKGKVGYGGVEKFEGETLIRRPLFVKGATGGKAPQVAYDTLNGKKAYENMRTDVLSEVTGWGKTREQKISGIKEVLSKYGADPQLAYEIVANSTEGNTLAYAVQENIVAHAVRNAGYDAVVGYSKGKDGSHFISEVFDTREQTYPAHGMDSEIHDAYYQGDKAQPRGWFRALPDGSFEIGKTSIGDLSTFIHEPAHSYLEILRDLSTDKNASEGLKGDYGKILDFLGAKEGEPLSTEQHEKWARANEQYLREGKAPSQSLKGVFQRFAVWLTSIYKRASDLGVELTDDIRGVFDRLYAAEDGVNRAEKESGPQLFSTPEEAGWTPEQFKAYADSKGLEVEQAKSEILSKLNEAAVRDRSESWREEEKNTREAVTVEIDKQPEYQAIRALREGKLPDGTELKLSREELVKQFGEERVKELQQQHKGLYRKEGGIDADTAAEMLGFESGDEMLRKLSATPRRAQAIEAATRQFMTAKHGDIRYDGTLNDQARLALENDKRAANLHKELNQLRKKLDETQAGAKDQATAVRSIKIAPIDAYRKAAKEAVQAKSLADMTPTRYLDASRKFSREAFDALRSGNVEEAVQAKHKELMNHFLFREATKARDLGDKIEAYAKKMSQTKQLGKLGLAGQPFLEQIQSFLSRYSFERGRGLTDMPTPRQESLDQFASRMRTEEGLDLPIDPVLLDESRKKNYRNIPFAELEAVYDAMRSIEHAAKQVNSVRAEGKRVALQQAATDLNLKLEDSVGKPEVRKSSDRARSFLERVKDTNLDIAALLPEFMFERFDGLSKLGPWHDYFWNRYNDAADHQNRLREMVFPEIMKFREANIDRSKKFYIQSIDRTLTKDDIISVALNSGNESNLAKQMKGGIQFEKDQGPTKLTEQSLHEILSHLTPDEIKMVNGIWKTIGVLKPEAAALERKRTGIEPKWIDPKPLDVANGTLEGGYYPLKYDPRFSAAGEKQSDASTVTQMFAKYASSNTRQGYLKGRTEFSAPLSLDWQATVSRHLDEVTTDISHWEFATDAQRLLKNPDVKGSIIRNLGDAYYKNLIDWVRYTVNQDSMGREASDNIEKFRRTMRNNVSTAVLGFRVMNAVAETGITPVMSLQHVSPESAFKGAMTYLRNPIEATRFAVDASDYVKRIDKEMDRNITEALNDLGGKTSLVSDIRRWAIMSRVAIWKIGAVMAWHQGYDHAMRKMGLEGPDAVRIADSIYRMTQESGRPGDLSAVQRNPYMKELTMFIGPSLIQYNNIRRSVTAFKDQGFNQRTAALGLTTLLAGHVVNNVLFNVLRGKGPQKEEDWPKWLLARLTFGLADGFPLARDAAGYAEGKLLGEHGKDFRLSPVLQMAKDTEDAALETAHALSGQGSWEKAIKQDARAVGGLTGLPAVQGTITGEYIYDVLTGQYKPKNAWSPVTDAFYSRPTKR
jgi:hypothetical protein